MRKNIVFYGDSNHGKSTLVGFISATIKETDMDKMEGVFLKKFGNDYKPGLLYTYLVNKNYWKSGEVLDQLTGMFIKGDVFNIKMESLDNAFRSIPLEIEGANSIECTFIDTPGQVDRAARRDEALHLGEIGVFCVEIGEVLKPEFSEEHFEKFEIWSKFSNEKPIILLTKLDLNLSEENYSKAVQKIKLFGGYDDDIIIIPIAILVNERRSINVFEKAAETPWYSGTTLIEAIKQYVKMK